VIPDIFLRCAMKVLLSFMPTAFAAFAVTPHKMFDANHMRDTFTAIAAANKDGKIDDPTRVNVRRILDLIEGNLTACLKEDYRLLGIDYNAVVDDLKQCNTDSHTCQNGPLAHAALTAGNALDTHKHCRQHELATCAWTNANQSVIDLAVQGFAITFPSWGGQVVDDPCDAAADAQPVFDWTNDLLGFLYNNGRGCNSDTADAEACRTQGDDHHTDGDGVEHTFGCNSPATGTPGSNGTYHECCDYKTCRANYLGACALYEAQTAQCDALEVTAENQHCAFLNQGCSCCSQWSTCWDSNVALVNAEITRAQGVVELIRGQQSALECLLCYGQQILDAGVIDVTACDSAPCEGCADFPDLDHDAAPRFVTNDECHVTFHGPSPKPDLGAYYDGPCVAVAFPSETCDRTCTNSGFGEVGDTAPNPVLNNGS